MARLADMVQRVVDVDIEGNPATIDLDHRRRDINPASEKRRAQMIDLDARADTVLAVVEMLKRQEAAGFLDIAGVA